MYTLASPWSVGPDDGCYRLEDSAFLAPWVLEKPMDPLEAMHMPPWPVGPVTHDHGQTAAPAIDQAIHQLCQVAQSGYSHGDLPEVDNEPHFTV
jgi:hypothetical protein